jgi:hypothetical protein
MAPPLPGCSHNSAASGLSAAFTLHAALPLGIIEQMARQKRTIVKMRSAVIIEVGKFRSSLKAFQALISVGNSQYDVTPSTWPKHE